MRNAYRYAGNPSGRNLSEMLGRLQSLQNRADSSELTRYVRETSPEKVFKSLHNKICNTDFPNKLTEILQGFSDSESCQVKRRSLVQLLIPAIANARVTSKHADAILNRIIIELPRFSKQHLVKLVEFCLTSMSDPASHFSSWKDLLPILLETLQEEKYISHMDVEVSGTEYKSQVISKICTAHWNAEDVPCLAKMFGDMDLTRNDRGEVLKALCRSLPILPPNQVPPFVYQTLKLCQQQDCKYILDGLNKYFQHHYTRLNSSSDIDCVQEDGGYSANELRNVESTVLYHVYQAAQIDHERMKNLIRYLTNASCVPEYILQPFLLSVLLSLSSIYEDEVFDILRTAIISDMKETEIRCRSAWLRTILSPTENVARIVDMVIDNSKKDRHLIVKGLANLAFSLMATAETFRSDSESLWQAGSHILKGLLKKRHEIMVTVLEELVEKIVAHTVPTIHYTDCLTYACRKLTVTVLDHQIWITTLLDRLLVLPGPMATQVLYAVFPLMHVSPSIRENLIMMLRKALYRKGTSKRKMAVIGFLEMLQHTKLHSLNSVSVTSSQRCNSSALLLSSSSTSVSTQVTLERNTQGPHPHTRFDKTLSYEILTILKKCLTYEFEVRLQLYKGLQGAALKSPEIIELVIDLLYSHFNTYLETDENILPAIKFDQCIAVSTTGVSLQEPIAELIFVLQKICTTVFSGKLLLVADKLRAGLKSLCKRMLSTELEHFNLNEEETNLQDGSLKSLEKIEVLKITIAIYEALMAFEIGNLSTASEESARKLVRLFKVYNKFTDFIKRFTGKSKKEGKNKKEKETNNNAKLGKPANTIRVLGTLMDLDTIRKALLHLYSQTSAMICKNYLFHRYVMQTCQQLLLDKKREDDLKEENGRGYDESCVEAYIQIGELLYKHSLLDLENTVNSDSQIAVLSLECFNEICRLVCTRFCSHLPRFLHAIFDLTDSSRMTTDMLLQKAIFSMDENLKTFLVKRDTDNEEELYIQKVPFLLLGILEHFLSKINFEQSNDGKVFEWSKSLARIENLQPSVVPAVFQFVLRVEEYTQEYGETLNQISLHLCEKLGTIDDTKPDVSVEYNTIDKDVAIQTYNVLNNFVKQKLNKATLFLSRLKAEEAIARTPGASEETREEKLREKERSFCRQLSYIAQTLHTMVNTSIDPGISTDPIFRNLHQLYNILGNLTKYFNAKSSGQTAAFQAVKFIQVVQLAGKPLKSAFYNLVTYVEECQTKSELKSDSYAQRNKILKKTKTIPGVIFEIEQFNKEVLLLAKKTSIPLENYVKQSVTRDFRIKNPQLIEDLEKMDTSALVTQRSDTDGNVTHRSEADCSDGEHNKENDSPARKRIRTST